MQVTIDQTAGFCTGVERSIRMAENELAKGGAIYCLGEILHNEQELDRLREKGLQTIDYTGFHELKNARVLIRAHGEPPETYTIAKENNLTLIDATCPVVRNIQRKIRRTADQNDPRSTQVVIIGKRNHPEVIGLNGQVSGHAIIISHENDLARIDYRKNSLVYVQTTLSLDRFQVIREKMIERSALLPEEERGSLLFYHTICRQVSIREGSLKHFAAAHDVLVFVSHPNSSNGRSLFEICKKENVHSYFITRPEDVQPEWFDRKQSVGVTGATSTPQWLLQKVAGKITEIVS